MKMIRFPGFLARASGRDAPDRHIQHAALPYVDMADGIHVCLITSRETGRWVIPKGWPKRGLAAHELAALEAHEEAGLKGLIGKTPLGRFEYVKRLHVFSSVRCAVDVYPLRVESQLLDFKEQRWRRLKWMRPGEAARLVAEPDLAALIAAFDPH